jgi:UDP-GlcNAc:undecaprenyl-phosphate GlcNAc-1-phosphate transferase
MERKVDDMSGYGRIFAAAAMAFVLSMLLTPIAIRLAPRVGAVDVPLDGRRMHTSPVPRMGGVAIFLAFVLPLAFIGMPHTLLVRLLLGATLLILLGIFDDVFRLSALAKLLLQIVACLIVVGGGEELTPLHLWGMQLFSGAWRVPVSVLWMVASINAHNMVDGLDGLLASLGAVEALVLSVLLALQGNIAMSGAALLVCGACLGYLPYNRHPARVFMGDTGSQFLGFVLGLLSLLIDQTAVGSLGAVVPLLVLAVPLSDLGFAVVRRIARGQSPFAADRGHWHHRLSDAGLGQRQVCFWMILIAALMGTVALLVSREEWYGYAVYAVLWVIVTLMTMQLLYGRRARRT